MVKCKCGTTTTILDKTYEAKVLLSQIEYCSKCGQEYKITLHEPAPEPVAEELTPIETFDVEEVTE